MDLETAAIVIGATSLIVNAIKLKNKKKQKTGRKCLWSRTWLMRRYDGKDHAELIIRELQIEEPKDFKNFCRMSPQAFYLLLDKVRPLIQKEDTNMRKAIPPTYRLLITLRYLARGSTFNELSFDFRVSKQSINNIVKETIEAIYQILSPVYLKVPQKQSEWKQIANKFEEEWNFPMCLGAIVGKHIAIFGRREYGSFYYNYKGFNSVILLAVVDANYKFIYANAGTNGRVNDSAVFNNCSFSDAIHENTLDLPQYGTLPGTDLVVPYVFVGDEAFRLTTRLMKPNSRRDVYENKIFNYRLSPARRVVENAFEILTSRFHVFKKLIDLTVDRVELRTLTACALHNFIKVEDNEAFNEELPSLEETSLLETGISEVSTDLRHSGNRQNAEAVKVRKVFTEYFNGAGAIPWQQDAVNSFNFRIV